MEAANTVEGYILVDHTVEGHTVEEHTIVNPQDQNVPKVGMMFASEDELYDYFKTYAYQIGFGVRKTSTKVNKDLDTTYYSLGCSKGGVYVPMRTKTFRKTSKTGCKAKICIISYGDGRCTISRVSLEHNHALSPKKSRFQRSHKKMDSYAKRRLELNDHAGDGRCRNVFHVTDIVEGKHGDGKKGVVYTVSYNEIASDIQCSCHLFEFRGIICTHMVKILIEQDVKEIHPMYILSRWRKDVKHGHYFVINCYEDLMSGDNTKQFDHLCSNFYEVAHMVNTREKYEYLLSCINMAKEKLNDDSTWGCRTNANLIPEDVHVPDSTTKLLPPLQVRSKGRPPSKRKESRVEKIAKKKGKKNVRERTENILQDQRDSTGMTNNEKPKYQFDLNIPV